LNYDTVAQRAATQDGQLQEPKIEILTVLIYVSVYLGHVKSFEELHEDVNWWSQDSGFGWYRKSLLGENTKPLGCFLYSTGTMDL
jgi:hypothetical protein